MVIWQGEAFQVTPESEKGECGNGAYPHPPCWQVRPHWSSPRNTSSVQETQSQWRWLEQFETEARVAWRGVSRGHSWKR